MKWRTLLIVLILCFVLILTARLLHRSLPQLAASDAQATRGVFHVHSSVSHDSKLSLQQIATAAKASHIQFVVLTDHNRNANPPVALNDVIFLSFPEISTPFGHLIQWRLPHALPKSVRNTLHINHTIADAGGKAIVAHPSHSKRGWHGQWTSIGGVEIANLSSSLDRLMGPLYLGFLPLWGSFQLNPKLTLAQLYDRDTMALEAWDAWSSPQIIGLCGLNAHGHFGQLKQIFKLWQLVIEKPIPPEPRRAKKVIEDAITHGRFHCNAGLFGHTPSFRFQARDGNGHLHPPGDSLPYSQNTALIIDAPAFTQLAKKGQSEIVLLRDGAEILRNNVSHLRYEAPLPGTYRVEVTLHIPNLFWGTRNVPIVYSNRIKIEKEENNPDLLQ